MVRSLTYFFSYLLLCGLVLFGGSCNRGVSAEEQQTIKPAGRTVNNDEKEFRLFLKEFKQVIKTGDKKRVIALLNFPLQTQPQWSNEDLKSTTINPADGLITKQEYSQYAGDIFTKDVIRLIPGSTEDDLVEIDNNTNENYYKTLKTVTDNGSKLYELQQQYVQRNNKETSYGFVFGKVKGHYKVISYFCPWPVKG
jgi:hypothetical protein